jgi:hypothetical protein
MAEAFGLDRRIEAYSGKRPIGLYRWDLDCLLAVMDLALKDLRAYPEKNHHLMRRSNDCMTGYKRNTEECGNERGAFREPTSASVLQGHDALNAHEKQIGGRQNQVTVRARYAPSFGSTELMPNLCEPHHGTAAADPSIASAAKHRCFVFHVFQSGLASAHAAVGAVT